MSPKQHITYGGLASVALSPILGKASIAFWIGSVLIDTDHYLEFIYHNRFSNFSIKRMLDYHCILGDWLSRPEFINLSIFHTLESLAIVYLLSKLLNSQWLVALFYGMLFHIILDTIHLYRQGATFKRAFSIIEFWIRKRFMRRNGLYPEVLYKKALNLLGQ
jgi:hypothetical protein